MTGFSLCLQFDGVTGFSLCVQFDGVTGFSFPLEHVRQYLGDSLDGAELHVYATVYDWFYGQEKTNHAWCRVVSSKMTLTFLGGSVRTFKPRAPLYAYVRSKPFISSVCVTIRTCTIILYLHIQKRTTLSVNI